MNLIDHERNIESSPRQAAGNLHRKDESLFSVRSLTPPQAARNSLAFAVQEAIDLRRIPQTSANGSPTWEAGFSQAVIDELKTDPIYGHNLSDGRLSVFGSVQGVIISPIGKLQYGAADRRRVGSVVSVKLKEIEDCRHCGW